MEENKEILFARTLEGVKKLAKEQGNCISDKQIREAFAELSLSEEQLTLVFDYLKKHRIGIGQPADLDEYLSEEETNYLEEYQKSFSGKDAVSNGEREAVLLSAMAGEKAAQEKLIHLFLPQVMEIAKLYTGQGVYLEDLIGEGNLALSAGAAMLGCAEDIKDAEGMLVRMIMDAMEESIDENRQEMDKDKKILSRVNKVAAGAKELARELKRKVTIEELAEETGISLQEISDAMRMSGFAIEDLEGSNTR